MRGPNFSGRDAEPREPKIHGNQRAKDGNQRTPWGNPWENFKHPSAGCGQLSDLDVAWNHLGSSSACALGAALRSSVGASGASGTPDESPSPPPPVFPMDGAGPSGRRPQKWGGILSVVFLVRGKGGKGEVPSGNWHGARWVSTIWT